MSSKKTNQIILRFLALVVWFCVTFLFFSNCSNSNFDKNITKSDLKSGLNLELDDSAFNKIVEKRNNALEENLLIKTKADYVTGTINSNGKKIKVKTRLKGDHVDHFEGNRWSFRVITVDGKLLNHQKVSIQGVHTRAYITEWIYHKLLKEEGLINLQYEFFPFCVNDTLCGIYAFESHFDNYLLENSNRKYGPIFKFNEKDFWNFSKYAEEKNRDDLLMVNSKISLTNKKWVDKNSTTKKAKIILDNFRKGKINCKDIFDLKIWAKFTAINELMAGDHGLRWHNLRFYYNPNTEKFEPIGFDCSSWMTKDKPLYFNKNDVELFHKLMLSNDNYKSLIKKELRRISDKRYIDKFFDRYQNEINQIEILIAQEKPGYKFWKSSFYYSQKRIINLLNQ